VTEGFDDVFERMEVERNVSEDRDEQLECILRSAIDTKFKQRSVTGQDSNLFRKVMFFNISTWKHQLL
jgi:hypothetical protein